jgi:hypothetical protein
MPSLTSIHPDLAPVFGLTEKALYERQKSLVRMKLLPTPKGRGRGSGAAATPENVAFLLIAVMVTDKQTDTEDRIRKLAFAAPLGKGRKARCPVTGAANFHGAISFLLSEHAPIMVDADQRLIVRVSRFEPRAVVSYLGRWPGIDRNDPNGAHIEYGATDPRKYSVLSVNAQLGHDGFMAVRDLTLEGAKGDDR